MVNKLFTEINTIMFLIFTYQARHKFGCNTMHAKIFSENLMTCGFWNSNFLCYFMDRQTTTEQITCWTFWIFPTFYDAEGRLECSLSSTEVPPSFKHLYHSLVCVLLMAFSVNAHFNILKVSENVFPNWKQNFTQTHYQSKSPILNCWKTHQASKTYFHSKRNNAITKQTEQSSLWHSPEETHC